MSVTRFLLFAFILHFNSFFSQPGNEDYLSIRRKYENLEKNNTDALPSVRLFIKKAKKEKDYSRLVQGYKDAVLFSSSGHDKMRYADSTILAALKSEDNDLISTAYLGKGIIHYFNFKKFEPALDEYLKAYQYAKNTKDDYLRYKVKYHLGVVKSYLGYYQDALELFGECSVFFENKCKQNLHPNELYNNTRGYYNSLHQMIVCYQHLKNFKVSDSLINVSLSKTYDMDEFSLERGYFFKCKGLLEYNHKNYNAAISDLNQSLQPILKAKDFAWASVVYYYLGKSYTSINTTKRLQYFIKVDSIFNTHHFILPDVRPGYEELIKNSKKEKNLEKELYYTRQLLKVDSVLSKDFTYLSAKIHKEYDTKLLIDKKEMLEQKSEGRLISMIIFIVLTLLFLGLFIIRFLKERKIQRKYAELQHRLSEEGRKATSNTEEVKRKNVLPGEERKSVLTAEQIHELSAKLDLFEINNSFIQKGLTQNKLAAKLGTNTSYLSTYINEHKKVNFNRYIGELRISYITKLLNSNKKYLNYTIEALAEECGISSRQNFSDLFYEINGIRPKDFIRKRKEELEGI
ncbi:AraC family transcriptional regulator [Chryseobacterium sp. OSA05B]|uniref:helix-turn-helix domain-containing protein n=1 Tax=Chryseobacterium sp. OSA05B TaxID=2862650 RepID=UPI001CBDC5A2|nr:helix-turn-helix domain-containing protein [Chryseobacterium sp. OSA05B]